MIVRKVHPDMPTTTVVLDLLSRVGSETRYSLSPFRGFCGETITGLTEESDFRGDALFDKLIRLKDCFNFKHKNIFFSQYEFEQESKDFGLDEEDDEDDIEDDAKYITANEVPMYTVSSAKPPEYIRRFEDYTHSERIKNFIFTVMRNAIKNKDGFDAQREYVSSRIKLDEDEDAVNENELAMEDNTDTADISVIGSSKKLLIRSIYRLMFLSSRVNVSMISILLSYSRFYRYNTSKIDCKPQFLVDNGPIYSADMNGDCVDIIYDPNDRAVKRAREVYWLRPTSDQELVSEFRADCEIFLQSLFNLNIDAKACDAKLYTREWVNYYSRKVIVDNYTYVLRKIGGYNASVLNTLRGISLDEAMDSVIETEVDGYTKMCNLLHEAELEDSLPGNVISELRLSNSPKVMQTITTLAMAYTAYEGDANELGKTASIQELTDVYSIGVTPEGFILDNTGDCVYTMFMVDFIAKQYQHLFTGRAYIHATGWVVFEPVGDLTYIAHINDILNARNISEDLSVCVKYVCGPDRYKILPSKK